MTLTVKQEAFCMAYLEAGNASKAYRSAYDAENMKPATINVKACNLLGKDKIGARIEELRVAITEEFVWERKDSLRVLAGIANSKNSEGIKAATDKDKISAVKELNSMYGYNAPDKRDHSFLGPDGEPLSFNINTVYVYPENK